MKRNYGLGETYSHGADEMRVRITTTPGIFAEGTLKGVVSEQGEPHPHLVVEMNIGASDPVEVTLDTLDLFTIVRLAKASRVQEIRDAVTCP